MGLPSWTSDYAATVQALASIGQAVLTVVALVVAIWVPWWQQKQARERDDRKAVLELAGLRHALHTEVSIVAYRCLVELKNWMDSQSSSSPKNFRTARLPSLAIYAANAGRIGLLTREEIVHLIGFAGTLHDISVVVDDMEHQAVRMPIDKQTIELLLSNACGHAADFLEAVPGIQGADQDRQFVEQLRAAFQSKAGFRAEQPPNFKRL